MAEDTAQRVQEAPPAPAKKSRNGCCCAGCLIIALVFLLALVGGGIYLVYTARTKATAAAPADIPDVNITEAQREEAVQKFETLSRARATDTTAEISLTPADLNAMIRSETQLDGERGTLVLDMMGEKLIADFSMPLENVPGFDGRYVNGSMVIRMQIRNGVLEVYPEAMQLNDTPVPDWLMQNFPTRNLADRIKENPAAREALKNIESLNIKDGKMHIRTTGT